MRRILWLLLFLVLFVTIRVTGGHFLGNFVTGILEKGTGAQVEIVDPRIEFFPPGASASGFSIRSAGEEGNSTAEQVSVDVDFFPLFARKLHMSNFRLEGIKINSKNTQSGFIKLIKAITRKKKPEEKKSKWEVRIRDVTLVGSDDPESLILEFPKTKIVSTGVTCVLLEGDKVDAKLFGKSTTFEDIHGTKLFASQVRFQGFMGKGVIEFIDSSFVYEDDNEFHFNGDLVLGDEGYYQIEYQSKFRDDYIKKIRLGGSVPLPYFKADLSLDGTLTDSLSNPDWTGKFEAKILENLPGVSLEECSPKSMTGEYLLKDKKLSLLNLNSEDFLTFGEFDLVLEAPRPVSFGGTIGFSEKNEFYRSCLGKITSLASSLSDLAESRQIIKKLDFDFTGNLDQEELKGTVQSEIETLATNSHASLNIDAELKGTTWQVKYQESELREGVAKVVGQSISAGEERGMLKVDVEVDTAKRRFDLKKFESDAYPGKRLIGRLSPFMSEDSARFVGKILGARSLISANLKESLNSNSTTLFDLGGQIVISNLVDGDQRKNNIECDLKSGEKGIELNNCLLGLDGGLITLSGLVEKNGGGEVSLWSESFDLESFYPDLPFRPVVGGELLVGFDDSKNIIFEGTGDAKLVSKKSSYTLVESGFKVDGDSTKLNLELSGGKGIERGKIIVPLGEKAKGPASLNLQLVKFSLGQTPDAADKNFLDGRLNYSGRIGDALSGEGVLEIQKINVGGKSVQGVTYPLRLELQNGNLEFNRIRLISGGADLLINGVLSKSSGWNLALDGAISLEELNWAQSSLEQLSGRMELALRVSGKASEPELLGNAKLDNGLLSFAVGRSIVGANEIEGLVNFQGKSLVVEKLEAKVGQGRLTGSGEWREFLSPEKRTLDLSLDLDDVEISPREALSLKFGGEVFLVKTEESPLLLRGDIDLENAYYEDSVDLFRMLASARDSIIGREIETEKGSGNTEINYELTISGENSILIETNIAKLEMSPELKILGNSSDPAFSGKVVLEQGSFGLQPEQFQLVSGELAFSEDSDPNNPELNIVGETRVNISTGDVVPLRINIEGTVTSPDVTFFSDSGLSDEELVALLGFQGNSLTLAEESGKELSLVEIINPSSDITLAERLTGLTGFSRLGIDSTFSDTTGELVPLVTAERKFSDLSSLYLESELRGEFNSAIFADYPLGDSVDVLAGWRSKAVTDDVDDSSGTFGVDIIYERELPGFRLFSRGLKEESREWSGESEN